jgi:hypothetical protein
MSGKNILPQSSGLKRKWRELIRIHFDPGLSDDVCVTFDFC